jgi:hypothetical protein
LLIYDAPQNRWENADLTASTGISVTNGAGSVTITNTAPDQTVVLTGGTGISTSGTYPNFTITNTAPSGSNTYTRTSFTATASQTTFTVSYVVGLIQVFVNGVLLNGADYTASNGTSVVLALGCNAGDIVETLAFDSFSVANTVSSFSGGTTGLTPNTASTGTVVLGGTLAVANGGTGITTAGSAGQSLITDGTTLSYGSSIVSDTAKASTSGTVIQFTGIPSWVKRITVIFSGTSTSGTSALLIQIGSTTYTTSGYVSASATQSGTGTGSTAGFLVAGTVAAGDTFYGNVIINNITSNSWVETSMCNINSSGGLRYGSGGVTLGGVLDRVRVTTANGTDTFDAGSINIMYE